MRVNRREIFAMFLAGVALPKLAAKVEPDNILRNTSIISDRCKTWYLETSPAEQQAQIVGFAEHGAWAQSTANPEVWFTVSSGLIKPARRWENYVKMLGEVKK